MMKNKETAYIPSQYLSISHFHCRSHVGDEKCQSVVTVDLGLHSESQSMV